MNAKVQSINTFALLKSSHLNARRDLFKAFWFRVDHPMRSKASVSPGELTGLGLGHRFFSAEEIDRAAKKYLQMAKTKGWFMYRADKGLLTGPGPRYSASARKEFMARVDGFHEMLRQRQHENTMADAESGAVRAEKEYWRARSAMIKKRNDLIEYIAKKASPGEIASVSAYFSAAYNNDWSAYIAEDQRREKNNNSRIGYDAIDRELFDDGKIAFKAVCAAVKRLSTPTARKQVHLAIAA